MNKAWVYIINIYKVNKQQLFSVTQKGENKKISLNTNGIMLQEWWIDSMW